VKIILLTNGGGCHSLTYGDYYSGSRRQFLVLRPKHKLVHTIQSTTVAQNTQSICRPQLAGASCPIVRHTSVRCIQNNLTDWHSVWLSWVDSTGRESDTVTWTKITECFMRKMTYRKPHSIIEFRGAVWPNYIQWVIFPPKGRAHSYVKKTNYNTRNILPANILQNDSVNVIFQHIAIFIILKYMILIPADDVCLQLQTTGSRFFFLILRISFNSPILCG